MVFNKKIIIFATNYKNMKSFKKKRLQEMRDSVWLAFHLSNKINEANIMEAQSRVPQIDDYIERFIWAFERITHNGTHDAVTNLSKNIFSNIKGCWFNDVNIYIEYKKDSPLGGDGVFHDGKNKIVDGKLNCLSGSFKLSGNWGQLKPLIGELISHEFLHAYENWRRLLGGKMSITDVASNSKYGINHQIKKTASNFVEETLSNVYYYCHNIERRAYAAQLNQALLQYKNQIYDTNSAMEILQNLPQYKFYVELGEKLQQINATYPQNQWYKADIERYYYELTGTEKKASQIMKFMNRLYQKTWYFFRKKAMRFIRHIHENNNSNPDWVEKIIF